jgi:hypothetical protein
MRALTKALALAAVSASMMFAAATAQAAVVNTAFSAPAGPYNLGNPTGIIAANRPNGFYVDRNTPNTYNFTFAVTPGIYNLHTELSALAQVKVANLCCVLTAEPISYTLWFGLPSGPNSLLGTSSLGTTAVLDLAGIAGGNYFMQINAANLANKEEMVSGEVLLSAVPEPAEWALMLTGVGLLGLAARRRRSLGLAAA